MHTVSGGSGPNSIPVTPNLALDTGSLSLASLSRIAFVQVSRITRIPQWWALRVSSEDLSGTAGDLAQRFIENREGAFARLVVDACRAQHRGACATQLASSKATFELVVRQRALRRRRPFTRCRRRPAVSSIRHMAQLPHDTGQRGRERRARRHRRQPAARALEQPDRHEAVDVLVDTAVL
jgi:hypothetical protein